MVNRKIIISLRQPINDGDKQYNSIQCDSVTVEGELMGYYIDSVKAYVPVANVLGTMSVPNYSDEKQNDNKDPFGNESEFLKDFELKKQNLYNGKQAKPIEI